MSVQTAPSRATLLDPKDKQRLEDVGFMTCMTLTLLGNYAQTGHFGGPLAYTPYNVAVHLAGPELGGLRHDYRRPKHPYGDKFMLAAGHCAPTCYALWMIMGEALYRKFKATGDKKYYVAPKDGFLAIDALGFRRGAGALKTLLQDQGLANDPLFAEAKEGGRGIHALSGHIESIDQSNDVNGGPSGVGLASAAGKAAFWDMVGAPINQPKVIAFEGEFALCAGHAQELKTQALALKVGKRLRVMFSENNAGIDDSLMGGVIDSKYTGYDFVEQWTSYGWNVMTMANGHDYDQIVGALKAMDDVDPNDRRPIIVIGKTIKGYWPTASNGKIAGVDRSGRRLPEPSLRDEDELGLLRGAGEDVRRQVRRRVPGHPQRRGDRHEGAARPVQDEHGRGDVGAREERPRRLARRAHRRDRRSGEGRPEAQHRRQAGPVPRRAPSRRRTFPATRRPSR